MDLTSQIMLELEIINELQIELPKRITREKTKRIMIMDKEGVQTGQPKFLEKKMKGFK